MNTDENVSLSLIDALPPASKPVTFINFMIIDKC